MSTVYVVNNKGKNNIIQLLLYFKGVCIFIKIVTTQLMKEEITLKQMKN